MSFISYLFSYLLWTQLLWTQLLLSFIFLAFIGQLISTKDLTDDQWIHVTPPSPRGHFIKVHEGWRVRKMHEEELHEHQIHLYFLMLEFLWRSKMTRDRCHRERKINERLMKSVVNLSFSFRTPSTSWYLLVGVKKTHSTKGSLDERTIRRKSLPTVETRTLNQRWAGVRRLPRCDFPVLS